YRFVGEPTAVSAIASVILNGGSDKKIFPFHQCIINQAFKFRIQVNSKQNYSMGTPQKDLSYFRK
ncbi:MAG: hypothetical protein ACN6PN_05235, partial [Sphingobacterium sp.]